MIKESYRMAALKFDMKNTPNRRVRKFNFIYRLLSEQQVKLIRPISLAANFSIKRFFNFNFFGPAIMPVDRRTALSN